MSGKRQYTLNENAFSNLTPESSYWLGFIAADGSISKRNNVHLIRVLLNPIDRHHIEKFQKFIGSSHPIYNYSTKSIQVTISNKQMYDDLFRYGIEPRKTYLSKSHISKIPDNYKKYFIAGLFDGDGSFVIRNKKVHNKKYNRDYYYTLCEIRILSNINTLEDIMDYLYKYHDISYSKIQKTKSKYVYTISLYSNKNIRNFYKLYKESPINLSRKLYKIENFINEKDNFIDKRLRE